MQKKQWRINPLFQDYTDRIYMEKVNITMRKVKIISEEITKYFEIRTHMKLSPD